MTNQERIINILATKIPLSKAKNNQKVYISKYCPFTGYISRTSNVFRYHTKLKVGKCYCCGKSFKDLYWLKQLLFNPFYEAIQIHFNLFKRPKNIIDNHIKEYFNKKLNKDKTDMQFNSFEKNDDITLPF